MNIILTRTSGVTATIGELKVYERDDQLKIDKKLFFCFTCEEMWRNNQRDNPNTPEAEESCIPPGHYFLRKRNSPKFGWTPYVIGTQPARDYILIHPGNTVEDLLGCIAPGLIIGKFKSKYTDQIIDGVGSSKDTFKKLMAVLETGWTKVQDIPFTIIGVGSVPKDKP